MGKFLSPIDLAAHRHETEVFNSMLNRGEIKDPEEIVRIHNITCGCGVEGCCFISLERKKQQ